MQRPTGPSNEPPTLAGTPSERKPPSVPIRTTRVSSEASIPSLPLPDAAPEASVMKYCHEIIEKDGGCYGCRLPAFHAGPHVNTLCSKTRHGRKPEPLAEVAPPPPAVAPTCLPQAAAAPPKDPTPKLIRAVTPRSERSEKPSGKPASLSISRSSSTVERAASAPPSRGPIGSGTAAETPTAFRRETGRERKPVARLVPNSGGGYAKHRSDDPGSCSAGRAQSASATPATIVQSASIATVVVKTPPSSALAPLENESAEHHPLSTAPCASGPATASNQGGRPKAPRKSSGEHKVRHLY